MANFYLELDERQAKFFEYSKESKDGFEKHEGTNGKVSFRKYYNEGVKGVLKTITERNEDFPTGTVKKLQIVVEKGGDRYFMKMSILNQNKSMSQYVEQLIPSVPNLKVGESYRFIPYEMENPYTTKDGVEKVGKNKGISVYTWDLDNDVKLVKVERAHSFAKDGDIPQVNWIPEEDMGVVKNVKDDKARRNFLYKILQDNLTETTSGDAKPAAQTKPQAAAPQAMEPEETFEEESHDDLPF